MTLADVTRVVNESREKLLATWVECKTLEDNIAFTSLLISTVCIAKVYRETQKDQSDCSTITYLDNQMALDISLDGLGL